MNLENKLRRAILSHNISKVETIFEEIYYEYGKLVAFIISKYVYRKEDVEELVDDVFVSFFKIIFKSEIQNIKYYLTVQSKNAAINFMKNKINKLEVIYNEEFVLNEISKDNLFFDLINDINKILNEEEMNIILLHVVYNYTFEELANKYHKPLSTIASTYRRAIRKINKGDKR